MQTSPFRDTLAAAANASARALALSRMVCPKEDEARSGLTIRGYRKLASVSPISSNFSKTACLGQNRPAFSCRDRNLSFESRTSRLSVEFPGSPRAAAVRAAGSTAGSHSATTPSILSLSAPPARGSSQSLCPRRKRSDTQALPPPSDTFPCARLPHGTSPSEFSSFRPLLIFRRKIHSCYIPTPKYAFSAPEPTGRRRPRTAGRSPLLRLHP